MEGGREEGVYSKSYTRRARFLTRLDQHCHNTLSQLGVGEGSTERVYSLAPAGRLQETVAVRQALAAHCSRLLLRIRVLNSLVAHTSACDSRFRDCQCSSHMTSFSGWLLLWPPSTLPRCNRMPQGWIPVRDRMIQCIHHNKFITCSL